MKRIYLSGPMTGLPGLNFPAFAVTTAIQRPDGHTTSNPTEIKPDSGNLERLHAPRHRRPDGQGHRRNTPRLGTLKGAHLEVLKAECLGMKVVNVQDWVSTMI